MVTFSIITVCFNSENYIKQTIESVLYQKYINFHYYIIDGQSTDNTINIIDKYLKDYPKKISFVSEKDEGIYDAMNKGICLVKDMDSYIIFLNSDDYFYNDLVLQRTADQVDRNDFVYGKVKLLYENKNRIFGEESDIKKLVRRTICHQSIFTKRSVFKKIGNFNLSYKIAADHDFVFKVFLEKSIKKAFVNVVTCSVRTTGFSRENILKGRKEYKNILNERIKLKDFRIYLIVHLFMIPRIYLLNLVYLLSFEKYRQKMKR